MRTWIGFGIVASLLTVLTACPEIGRMTYRFDLNAGKGELRIEDIGTDDASKAREDFAQIVNEYILGSKVQDDHPAWRVGNRELYARDGRLDAKVDFEFSKAEDVGLYKHDKKSPYFWCAPSDETVATTSGVVMPQYPNCVVFDRKDTVLEVTVSRGGTGKRQSLLAEFEAWDGKAIAAEPGLGDLGGMFKQAFEQAMGEQAGEGEGDGGLGVLGSLLPKAEPSEAWKALGLPVAGSQIVFQNDDVYQASHALPAGQGDGKSALAAYTAALGKLGWKVAEDQGELVVWERDGARITGTATKAGSNVIVALSR